MLFGIVHDKACCAVVQSILVIEVVIDFQAEVLDDDIRLQGTGLHAVLEKLLLSPELGLSALAKVQPFQVELKVSKLPTSLLFLASGFICL